MYPHESGFVYWTKKAWGNFGSFLDGWLLTWIVIIDQAIYPRIFVDYLHNIHEFDYWSSWGICLAFVAVCFCVNLLGVESVGISSTLFSILALLPFLIFFVLGFLYEDFQPSRLLITEGEWNTGLYLSVLVWSTCGYDYAGFLGTDLKNPKKNFPRVMSIAVLLMTLTYVMPIITTISTYPNISQVTEGYYPLVASHLGFGEWLKWLMIGGGFVSCAGTFNAVCTLFCSPPLFVPSFLLPSLCSLFFSPLLLFPHLFPYLFPHLFFSSFEKKVLENDFDSAEGNGQEEASSGHLQVVSKDQSSADGPHLLLSHHLRAHFV